MKTFVTVGRRRALLLYCSMTSMSSISIRPARPAGGVRPAGRGMSAGASVCISMTSNTRQPAPAGPRALGTAT